MDELKQCFEMIGNARKVSILTGAGVSTLSGIPDFRGKDGFYTRGELLYGVKREELFDIGFFKKNPEIFYRYAVDFLYPMLSKTPSVAHTVLGAMQRKGLCGTIYTQNIDTLHTKGGAAHVAELHGSLGEHFCISCGTVYATPQIRRIAESGQIPLCKSCSGLIKPKVVFFGEMLPEKELEEAFEDAASSDLFLVLGSSLTVTPAAHLPQTALNHGRRIVIVNAQPTSLDRDAAFRFEDIARFCTALQEHFSLLT